MQRGFKSWAEIRAREARLSLGLGGDARLPARLLLRHLKATVTTPGLIPDLHPEDLRRLTTTDSSSWSAVTCRFEAGTFVILNDSHTVARQESNLHHEAAHLICGHQPSDLVQIGGLILRGFDDIAEKEATWLGGCLHLPREALLKALRDGADERMLQERFVASPELVRFRRSMTGVDGQLEARRPHSRHH